MIKLQLLASLAALIWVQTAWGAEARYVARFADGTRQDGNALVNWHACHRRHFKDCGEEDLGVMVDNKRA